jgi:hypothetical protein
MESGLGLQIWRGYLRLLEEEKQKDPPDPCPLMVVPEDAPVIDRFREAIDVFFHHMTASLEYTPRVTLIEVMESNGESK